MSEVTVTLPQLHPGQLDIAHSRARFRVAMCGRRFGKTLTGITEACEAMIAGQAVGWFAPTYRYALDAWRDVLQRLRPIAREISEQGKRITLVTKGSFELWTCDTPDPGRGRAYDLAIIDEAGIIRDLDVIWGQAIRPTLTDREGRALFLGTPKGRTHAFSRLYAKAETSAPLWQAFRKGTAENPYIPAHEVTAAQQELLPGVFAQEYQGVPADDAANPFGLTAIAQCVQPLGDPTQVICWGWDFARAEDWTVGIALDKHYRVVQLDRWQGRPWGETKAAVQRLTGKHAAWGDSTGVGDPVVEDLQRVGVPMQGYTFTRPSKQKLMERLAGAIQQQTVHFPDGVIRAELETFGYEYTPSGVYYSAPEGLHDDCVMALALAVYGRDQFGLIHEPVAATYHSDTHPGFDYDQRARKRPWLPDETVVKVHYVPSHEKERL